MLVEILDAESGKPIYFNPHQVAVIFEGVNPEGVELTMLSLVNGSIATTEPMASVIAKIEEEVSGW